MISLLRLCVSAAAAGSALVFAGSAFAAYNPSILVAGTNHSLSRSGPVVIGVDRGDNDDATGEVTVYSPLGYRVTLGQAPGAELGGISGQYQIGARVARWSRSTGVSAPTHRRTT